MERKKNEELLKQLRKMPSRELIMERKRNEDLCKQLREANLKLQALQNADTPSKWSRLDRTDNTDIKMLKSILFLVSRKSKR